MIFDRLDTQVARPCTPSPRERRGLSSALSAGGQGWGHLSRHIALMLGTAIIAVAAGIVTVPGPREQWTMLVRDERNDEALEILQQRYAAGERDPEAMLQLYKLLMSLAKIDEATRIIEEIVTRRPNDASGLAELAKHYEHTQDFDGEMRTLERLVVLQPSSSSTAERLLVLYRLHGYQAQEQRLLAKMLPAGIITAGDAERLGFMRAAQGDLQGALEALLAFDSMATPEYSTSRFALVDVLLRLGEPQNAMARMQNWLLQWHDNRSDQELAATDFPVDRLVRMMVQVNRPEARRIICGPLSEMPPGGPGVRSQLPSICAQAQTASGDGGIDPDGLELTGVVATAKANVVAPAARRNVVAASRANAAVRSTR